MFVLVIGSMDDFTTEADLMTYYHSDKKGASDHFVNASVYELSGQYDDDIAQLILFGIAFRDDWCMDGTTSIFFKE
jgi:hypothetical protein